MRNQFALLLVAFILSACTNEQLYNSVQTNQRNECEKLQLSQREECMQRLGPDYKTYERERQ